MKKKPIIIHNEAELLAWLDHQINASEPNLRPIKFSKKMIEESQMKLKEKSEV